MADWPRRIQGHYVDRELGSIAGNVEYEFRCIRCGVRTENPDDQRLKLEPCDPLTPGVGKHR